MGGQLGLWREHGLGEGRSGGEEERLFPGLGVLPARPKVDFIRASPLGPPLLQLPPRQGGVRMVTAAAPASGRAGSADDHGFERLWFFESRSLFLEIYVRRKTLDMATPAAPRPLPEAAALAPAPSHAARSVALFTPVEQVGEGTYGQVYKAKNKETNEIVALKRVRMDNEKEGFPITAIREIKILKILNHKNIVKLKEVVTGDPNDSNQGKGSIYMVMEYCEHDLTGLLDSGQRFSMAQIKCYIKQLLEGIAYCHKQNILHRDIKGSNLLINDRGQLKLADFGLARPIEQNVDRKCLTNRVITLWYRPPELLLGAVHYGTAIDMWSTGCILAELLLRKPILPGRNEYEQLDKIFQLCGTPTDSTWPGVSRLPYYTTMTQQVGSRHSSRWHEKFKTLEDRYAHDLLRKLLEMDPSKRISAIDALNHDFFWEEPLPSKPENLPKYPPSHEYTTKKKQQQADSSRDRPPQMQQNPPPTHQGHVSSSYGPQRGPASTGQQSQQHARYHPYSNQNRNYNPGHGPPRDYPPGQQREHRQWQGQIGPRPPQRGGGRPY